MEDFIRSASLGPPKRAASASGLRPRLEGGAAEGSLAVVVEFSTLHFNTLIVLRQFVDVFYEFLSWSSRKIACCVELSTMTSNVLSFLLEASIFLACKARCHKYKAVRPDEAAKMLGQNRNRSR
jgi:hypothetical protein